MESQKTGSNLAHHRPRPPSIPPLWLWVEFTVIFLLFPCAAYHFRSILGRTIIPVLLLVSLVFLIVLLRDGQFDRRQLWKPAGKPKSLYLNGTVFAVGSPLLALTVWILEPDLFLRFPRERPLFWLLVLLAYPFVSVYPQELIFRVFLFHRYRSLFSRPFARIVVSGLVFGLAHLFLANWWAPLLSTAGGTIFALTYERTGSARACSIEHALWGDYVFTLGLGWYFYGGSIASS